MTAAPAPSPSFQQRSSTSEQISAASCSCWRTERARLASRPTGVRMSTLLRSDSFLSSIAVLSKQLVRFAGIGWDAGQHAVKFGERGSQGNALGPEVKFPDHAFMSAATLLNHRDCFMNG